MASQLARKIYLKRNHAAHLDLKSAKVHERT